MTKPSPRRSKEHYLLGLGGVLLIGFTLSIAKPLLTPLAFAVLLSFVLAPLVARLERIGLARGSAVMIVVCLAFAAIGMVGWVTAAQVEKLAVELPHRKAELREKLNRLKGMNGGALGDVLRMVRELNAEDPRPADDEAPPEPKAVLVSAPQSSSLAQILEVAAPVAEPLATAGLVIVLVLFMLTNREDLRDRIIGLLGHGRIAHTTRMLGATATRLSHYLLAQIIVNASVGLLYALVIWIIGVPFALLGGLLVALLRFVPYIGTWLAAAFPLLLSVALFPGWGATISMFVAFVVIDLLVSNAVEPLFLGRNTGVTPIALLVAAAFWTWIWGPVGLVLSTPLTVCLVVLGQHVPRFHFLALLLGGQASFPPHVRYYQRLLAGDETEARAWVQQYLNAHGAEALSDQMIIPALGLARSDRKRSALSADEEQGIYRATERILQSVSGIVWAMPPERDGVWRVASEAAAAGAEASAGDHAAQPAAATLRVEEPGAPPSMNGSATVTPEAPPSPTTSAFRATVIGCPAHHAAEGLIQALFAAVARGGDSGDDFRVRAATCKALPIDILEAIVAAEAPIVFISVLPPGGLPQARYLCETIRRANAKVPIVVGYWGKKRQFDRVLVSLRTAGASYVTTSLAQSRSQIKYLAERLRDEQAVDSPSVAPLLTGGKQL